MKTLKLITLMVIILSMNFVYSQEKVKKVKIYKTWISLIDESEIQGILYELKDSSILITDIITEESQEIEIKDIQKIKIRRKNGVGRGAIIGTVSGFVAGGLIGLADGDGFFSKEETALLAGVFFSGVGAGVGAIIGKIKKKFDINGSISNYNKNIRELREYAVKK